MLLVISLTRSSSPGKSSSTVTTIPRQHRSLLVARETSRITTVSSLTMARTRQRAPKLETTLSLHRMPIFFVSEVMRSNSTPNIVGYDLGNDPTLYSYTRRCAYDAAKTG